MSQNRKDDSSLPRRDFLKVSAATVGAIGAGGIVGLLGVALKGYEATVGKGDILNFPHTFLDHDYVSVLAFAALAFSLYYFARKPLKK